MCPPKNIFLTLLLAHIYTCKLIYVYIVPVSSICKKIFSTLKQIIPGAFFKKSVYFIKMSENQNDQVQFETQNSIHTQMRHTDIAAIFLGQFCPRGKGTMRLTTCEASTHGTKPHHNPGNSQPYTRKF